MKKKLLLIVSMLAVTLMFAGCGKKEETVEFTYVNDEIAAYAQQKCNEYMYYAQQDEFYRYITEAGESDGVSKTDIAAVKAFKNIDEECGEFIAFEPDYEITENGSNVIVTLFAQCKDEQAQIRVTCTDNTAVYDFQKYMCMTQYSLSEEDAETALASQGVLPYKAVEFEISANMTFKQKMKSAGVNTIIGMGVVFVALIFISFIISLLKYVPMLFDKEARKKKKAEKLAREDSDKETDAPEQTQKVEKVVDIVNTATGESVMDNEELVAVITAAVAAATADKPAYVNYPSNDKLIARSIRRIKR